MTATDIGGSRGQRALVCSALALAGLAVVPASASADGRSCTKPNVWKLTAAQVEKASQTSSSVPVWFRHGPVRFRSGGDPLSTGPIVTASASGPWRICTLSGLAGDGRRWSLPGSRGTSSKRSLATGRIGHDEQHLAVSYARRRPSTGGCADPSVAYVRGFGDTGATLGDAGATLRVGYSGTMRSVAVASWSLLDPDAEVCLVGGYSHLGKPWLLHGGPTRGSHTMHRGDDYVGTHDNPVIYLWIAFASP